MTEVIHYRHDVRERGLDSARRRGTAACNERRPAAIPAAESTGKNVPENKNNGTTTNRYKTMKD